MSESPAEAAPSHVSESTETTIQAVIKQCVDLGEQVFRLLRDFALGALFILLVVFPSYLNKRLSLAGFTKIDKGGIVWEKQVEAANEQTKVAAATVAGTSQTLQDVNAKLSEAAQQSKDPQVKAAIEQSITQLSGTLGQVTKADQSLQETVLTQQDLLAQSSTATSTRQEGWLYVGEVDEAKRSWVNGSPKNMLPVSLPLAEDQAIVASGLNYLRGDSASKQHKDASVASVVRDRTRLKIEDVDYSHALGGGWFVWLKVVSQ